MIQEHLKFWIKILQPSLGLEPLLTHNFLPGALLPLQGFASIIPISLLLLVVFYLQILKITRMFISNTTPERSHPIE